MTDFAKLCLTLSAMIYAASFTEAVLEGRVENFLVVFVFVNSIALIAARWLDRNQRPVRPSVRGKGKERPS